MKRYALISLILLVAFMWSCENKSSSPYTPEDLTTLATNSGDGTVTVAAQGGKGKGKGPRDKTATYTVDVVLGLGANPVVSDGEAAMGSPNYLHAYMGLDLTVLPSPLEDCFPGGGDRGVLVMSDRNFIFYFTADNGVNYGLHMIGGLVGGTWPPADDGKSTTFAGSELQLKFNGGEGKKECLRGRGYTSFPLGLDYCGYQKQIVPRRLWMQFG